MGRNHWVKMSPAYQVENQKKFYEKWEDVLEREHLPNAQDPFLTRDRSQLKKRILVIDHRVPIYDNDAGARTVLMYTKLFLELGMQVTFLPNDFFPLNLLKALTNFPEPEYHYLKIQCIFP